MDHQHHQQQHAPKERVHNPYATATPQKHHPQQASAGVQQQQSPQQAPPAQQQQQPAAAAAFDDDQQQQQQTSSSSPNMLDFPPECVEGTLHKPLIGYVSFCPHPKTAPIWAPDTMDQEHPEMYQRIFIGQLPYGITDMQLQWMAQIFGGGVTLYAPEVIIKGGKKTGCVHARVHDAQLKQLVAGCHKRLLVDDTGVWVGRTAQEIQILTQYVSELKADPKKRYPDRPYDTVVVQNATSDRQQHHQGLPGLEEYFAQQHGMY